MLVPCGIKAEWNIPLYNFSGPTLTFFKSRHWDRSRWLGTSGLRDSIHNLPVRKWNKGPFINYITQFWQIFDPLPLPAWHFMTKILSPPLNYVTNYNPPPTMSKHMKTIENWKIFFHCYPTSINALNTINLLFMACLRTFIARLGLLVL